MRLPEGAATVQDHAQTHGRSMRNDATPRAAVRHRIQSDLVNVLERTRLMQGPVSRELALEQLRERLGSLALREHSALRLQIAELVHVCAGLPGAVAALIEVVEHLEPGTAEVADLRCLADEWEAADTLSDEDWSGLRPVLEPVCPSNLAWLYQRATEHRLPGPPSWCVNAWHAFVHLAGQNAGPDGLPPNMLFLALLELEVEPDAADRIRTRNRQLATAHDLTAQFDERRLQLAAGKDEPTESTAYLVIQVEPELGPEDDLDDDAGAPQRYALSHARQWHGGGSWHSRPGRRHQVRREDLEREVERLIDQMESEWWDRPGTVVVEFVLPWELLNLEVDWWRKESGSPRPTALAMDYPIVVRSLERLRTRRWHRAWHERWRQLQSEPASSLVHWSRPAGQDYFTRLESELKSDKRVVSLVLSEPPTRPGRAGQQEVEAALRSGLPVVIWHRADCTTAEFREAVTRLISDGGLAQLPMRAKELRLEALRLEPELRDNHIGRYLTVLWDDPERRPDPPGSSSGRVAGEFR